ncbi:MAG: hypothetical protein AVDCRST_MAG25-3063 [uncultured Rubrobacteraceae bacterium]|uniref:Uncharacterized protein n=1 Tax=uncultured Rubrobacteraceae bacterium TaxID=349277 RepID=A0A6J4RZ83_9ACTN|nr:MAG: hypothetical protein AVDCRST_MAG25-3063 [uncultured Rubrobacteraceae bacterium]
MRSESREKEMEERIEAAFRRRERGEGLTERDRSLIQYSRGAGAYHACGSPGMVIATRIMPDAVVEGGVR